MLEAQQLMAAFKGLLQRILDTCSHSPQVIELIWGSPILLKMLILDTSSLLDREGDPARNHATQTPEDGAVVESLVAGVVVVTLRFVKRLVSLHEQRNGSRLLPREATTSLFYELLYRFTNALNVGGGSENSDDERLQEDDASTAAQTLAGGPAGATLVASMEALLVIYTLCLHDGHVLQEIRLRTEAGPEG